ncbi:MAG: Hsp20/alpha crystallin family protein [Desulfovibrionaceae bacterium]|nr:Hsp20/alpha crystallin family protein [Desulfovibrionaceae bacterium]MDD4951615.1 Hsp20/alpha crystallin family protein [Desulfovibrionaceae bacterium]
MSNAKSTQKSAPCHYPATDILEREDGFHILMDLPGVGREDLSVELDDTSVTVHGKSSYHPDGGRSFASKEFGCHSYERRFTISEVVDREGIRAELSDGVLDLFLPKAEKIKPRRIEIKTA